MIRYILTTAFLLVFLSANAQEAKPAAPAAKTAEHGYIGVKKCIICHKGENKGMVYEKWLATKHSKAYQTLVEKKNSAEKKAECLVCHTTGYGHGGYVIGADNAADFEGIQCEACHGGGADFKPVHSKDPAGAAALGFVAKPNEETCKKCHNAQSPTFDKTKPFNFEVMHKIIDHRYRQKAK